MKKYLIILILFSFNLISTELLAEERVRGKHVLVTKIGSFELDKANQSSSRTFTTKSDAVFGLEYEWHMWKGLSIGGEVFYYENDFTTPTRRTAEISSHLFNVKYHFNHDGAFQPFIGIGRGFTYIAATGESFIDTHFGPAYQYTAGFTYRFKYVGIYAEYKVLNSRPEDELGSITVSEIDTSGKGFLMGVSVLF